MDQHLAQSKCHANVSVKECPATCQTQTGTGGDLAVRKVGTVSAHRELPGLGSGIGCGVLLDQVATIMCEGCCDGEGRSLGEPQAGLLT